MIEGSAHAAHAAHAALEASEERLRLATEAAGLGIWVWTLTDDKVTWENERLYEMFGVPVGSEPINGARFLAEVVHPDDRVLFERAFEETLKSGARLYFLGRFYRGTGELRWAEFTGHLHRTPDGTPLRLVGTGLDVTDRQLADEYIRRGALESAKAAEANAKFRTMFEQDTQFAGLLTPEGLVVEANHLCLDACGYLRDDVLGKPFWECGWWNRSTMAMELVRDATRGAAKGVPFRCEIIYFVADGSERMVDLVLAPVTSDEGRVLFVAATGTDITERKRAERELRVTNERLKLLVDNSKDYAVVITDLDGTILEWQGAAERITGFAPAEAVGQRADLIFTPEDRARAQPAKEMSRTAETGRADDKRWHLRKDGSRFFADGVMTALYTDDGKLRGFGKVFRDVTAEELTAEALKASAERLRFLDALGEATRSASDPAAVMRATTELLGRYLGVTRCAYADVEADNDRFGIRDDWTAEGVASSVGTYRLASFGPRATGDLHAGRTLLVRDVDAELAPAEGGDTFNSIGVKAIICCPLVKDGRLVAMMAVHQAEPRAWSGTDAALVEDVVERSWAHIERVRASDELRAMDRRKDEFLATLAHELRNPLAPIRTGLQVLKLAPSGPGAERAREMMDRQLAHMVRLIDDLMDISRISRGKLELRRESIALRAVLENAIEASRPLIEAMGHELVVRLPERAVTTMGDLTRLAQVVSNLLDNSAKYTPRGGRIELSTEVTAGSVRIRVVDNGTGIAADVLPQVFDLFSQANRTLNRGRGGLGIGLSLARRLTELHGGAVTGASAGAGLGSTFTVRLPIEEPSSAQLPAAAPAAPLRPAGRRILVVDDNVDGAEMLATMLELGGHEARVAHDGPEALAVARELRPEMVFLDLGLPGMDGYEVARQLRADDELKGAVLVALTGWGSADDKRRTKEAGFDRHLTKPVATALVDQLIAELSERAATARS